MKKFLALLASLLLVATFAAAETPAPVVFVSVTDGTGALVLAYAPVTVTDADGDGLLTIADALTLAHVAHHPAGAAAFTVEKTQYGISMVRLWDVDNGGVFGYCLNDASSLSLADPVQPGDHIKAYCFTDLAGWSDAYSFFAAPVATVAAGEPLPLCLSAAGYDDAWNPVTLSVAGAVITVDGMATETVTDDAGCATLAFAEPGVYVVSATSDTMTLVAPVCIVTVTAE